MMKSAHRDVGPRRVRIGLTGRLLLLVILAVVPALVIQAWNEYDQRIAREDDIRQHVVEITKQFGEEIGVLREGARQLLLALAQLDPVKSRQTDACSTLFAKLKSRYVNYSQLGAADTAGRVFCSSGPISPSLVIHQPFFKRALALPELAVGNYWVDPADGRKIIHFAERFDDGDGRIAGVVFAGLDLDWLSDHLKKRGLAPTASILIADREGNIIARLPHPELFVGKNMRKSHEPIMDGDEAGWEEAAGVDGVMRIYGYVPAALPPNDFFLSAGQSKTEAFAAIDSATWRGVALILAGLLAAIYAAWIGGRKFIRRPIDGLLKVTAEWRNGNYGARAHLHDRASEIGRLGSAFDDMADALAARHDAQKRAEEELRQLNATLEVRIQQRTIELERALQAKSQFLANMSHEIRTPLNGVLGMLELVGQTELGPTQQRFLETARRSAETLLSVINEVLDLSKIEAGRVELEHSAFDLRTVVEDVTEAFSNLAFGKGLELACLVPVSVPTALVGDPGRVRQILTNLIGNAIKFTERGGVSVRVQVREQNDSSTLMSFEVTDTGIGIPVEKREQIFEAFAQADSSTTRRYGGTGLGLTIAKHFCEMMGGTIHVASEPGVGSSFSFTARFGLQKGAVRKVENASPASGGIPILVVSDNTFNYEILIDQLSAQAIRVDQAKTGSEAIVALGAATLRGERYGWAIIDNSLPDMSGAELARAIRSTAANSDLRLMLLTPLGEHTGASRDPLLMCLTKPIRQAALWDCLASGDANAATTTRNPPETSASLSPGSEGARVLLVDDEPVALEVCCAMLESVECTVETAADGLCALERHASSEFDLIFMDCMMPEMNGYEVTAEIRRREARSNRRTPVIALTADVTKGARERCLRAGMDDYLAKPYKLDQLKAMLTQWLNPLASSVARDRPGLVAASPALAGPIDYKVLDSLRQLQRKDRPDNVQEVVESFFKSAARLLQDLEEGAAKGDTTLLHEASHALKSASANVGAVVLSSRCEDLESMARSGIVSDPEPMVRAILEDYRAAEILLSNRLPKVA
jgi:signal transduction histidine kinase/DNA-binding response OmpR family regulator/HPt (histidine-containing phosphotransfer) domain-containing protein